MGADKFTIGASLLTSQHPFYVLLANAMKEEAAKDGVDLNLTIANQDLSKPVSFKKIRLKNELKAWEAASPQDRIRFDEQLPT